MTNETIKSTWKNEINDDTLSILQATQQNITRPTFFNCSKFNSKI